MRTVLLRTIALMAALALSVASAAPGDDGMRSKQLDEILSELQKIRALIESGKLRTNAQNEVSNVAFDVKDSPMLGSEDAPITIVECIDYQCHYCRQFYRQTFKNLKRMYLDSKKLASTSWIFHLTASPAHHCQRARDAARVHRENSGKCMEKCRAVRSEQTPAEY